MSNIAHSLSTNIMLALGYYAKNMTIEQRYRLGKKVGNLFIKLSKSRAKITENNIKSSLPNLSEDEVGEIVRGSYQNLGITLIELLGFKYFKDEDYRNYVKYDNIELINEVLDRGKGLILLSGHFGNWELLASTVGRFANIKTLTIVKPQSNKKSDKILNQYRTNEYNSIVNMHNSARKIVQTLRNGGTIALLADQSATKDKDIFVDFFGRPAATYEAPAALSLKFGSPIIMGFAVRQPDFTYRVKLREIRTDDLENTKEGILELTQRHVNELENEIRKHPHLWAWQHRRWKHKKS